MLEWSQTVKNDFNKIWCVKLYACEAQIDVVKISPKWFFMIHKKVSVESYGSSVNNLIKCATLVIEKKWSKNWKINLIS